MWKCCSLGWMNASYCPSLTEWSLPILHCLEGGCITAFTMLYNQLLEWKLFRNLNMASLLHQVVYKLHSRWGGPSPSDWVTLCHEGLGHWSESGGGDFSVPLTPTPYLVYSVEYTCSPVCLDSKAVLVKNHILSCFNWETTRWYLLNEWLK